MRSLRDIKRLVGHAKIHSKPDVNRAILDDLLQELAASTQDRASSAKSWYRIVVARGNVARAAVAAGIVVGVLLGVHRFRQESRPVPSEGRQVSAAEMLTAGRLNAAYRRDGLQGLERQCEKAAERLGLRPSERTPIDRFF
jgi:hypothetical protein